MTEKENNFRKGVLVLIMNKEKKLLMCRRTGMANRQGGWQAPEGGIDESEEPKKAALREAYEETGITADKLSFLAETKEDLSYIVPEDKRPIIWINKRLVGQRKKAFLFKFSGTDKDINLNIQNPPEFETFRWVSPREALEDIVSFKAIMYAKAFDQFGTFLAK